MTQIAHDDADPSGMDALIVHLSEQDGVVVVRMSGELDMATFQRANAVVDEAIRRGKPMVLDLTGLTFFSSAGLTLLAQLAEQRRHQPVELRLVADQRAVVMPLRVAGLDGLFPRYPTVDDALNANRRGDPSS